MELIDMDHTKTMDCCSKQRDAYVDFIKGITMLTVIIGHSIVGMHWPFLLNMIYSFHMPLLMYLSGYVDEKRRENYKGRCIQFLRKRLCGLIIPYLTWALIHFLFYGKKLYQLPYVLLNEGPWFLAVLFGLKCMHLVFWIITDRAKDSTFICIVKILLIWLMVIGLSILTKYQFLHNMISYAIPYFVGAVICSDSCLRKIMENEKVITGAIILYIFLFHYFDFENVKSYTQILRIVLSLCVIVLLHNCRGIYFESRLTKLFCLYGRESMAIYLLHGWITDYVACLDKIGANFLGFTIALGVSIIVAGACVIIKSIVSRSRMIGMLFFGGER